MSLPKDTIHDAQPVYGVGESVQPTVHVDRETLPIAIRHGMELWWDGSTPTKRLDDRGDEHSQFTRFVNARIEGKLAEQAVSTFLDQYFGIDSAVDWRIYGDYETTDDGDLQYLVGDDGGEYPLAVDMDVKKTKPWNQWLAVRTEIFDRLDDDAPVILTKLALTEDLDLDPWEDTDSWDEVDKAEEFRQRLLAYSDNHFPLEVELVGTAYPDEFTDTFEAGEKLYDPTTGATLGGPLKRDNVGIHVRDLVNTPQRWNRVVCDIVGDNPVFFEPLTVVDDPS